MYIRLRDYVYNNKPIGVGSFAKVYKGINIINKKKVAIKKINKKKLNKKLQERLKIEIKLIQIYHNHENIVDLYDVLYSDNNDYVFIIMEYCNCGDLGDYIKNNKLDENNIKYYMNQLRNGIQYLIENNVIHRDLKPKNIMLTKNYKILKITDFGFARSTIDDISLMDTLCGSPLYMAPEMMLNKKYNIKSDLWSIGIILYEMIYNIHPYGNPINIIDLIDRIKKKKIYFPKNNISDECLNLLSLLLQVNDNERITWNDFFNHSWFDKVENLNNSISNIEDNLLFDIELDDNNDIDNNIDNDIDNNIDNDIDSSVTITKVNDCLDDLILEDHMKSKTQNIPIKHIQKDGTLIDFEIVDNRQSDIYIGSLPVEQRARSYSTGNSILKNSLAYLNSSLQILKSPTSKLLNLISQ